ncbi:MAG TPA: hypothetical protein VGO57_18865 [Verrucomicrobiae bacterium]
MNKCSLKKIIHRWIFPALLVLVLLPRVSAQATVEPPQRWLLIFDTSFVMKNRLPALKTELKNLFLSSISGQLHAGDSVGVWTFNKKLEPGVFPQFTWTPTFAAEVSSNLVRFLSDQSYSGGTSFASLTPLLGRVIDNSDRLTILIFCDGQDELKMTPYDAGINQVFAQSQAERKKSGQPFVLLIRTQTGQFVGATVNLPPGNLDVPPFPPLPVEALAPPANAVANPPPVIVPRNPVSQPPLVIVGTNVGTNIDELLKPPLPAGH